MKLRRTGRRRRRLPPVLCLTGSIAMGKSVASAMFRELRVPVFDADAEVHRLLAAGGAGVAPVRALFPEAFVDGGIDRKRLGGRVFGDPQALGRLEAILHPMVGAARAVFLGRARARGVPLVVLDIPLLFEGKGGGRSRCDQVAVVSAPAVVQRARALRRPNMDRQKLADILARQMPDAEKRRRADFVIPSGLGLRVTRLVIRRIVRTLIQEPWENRHGRA